MATSYHGARQPNIIIFLPEPDSGDTPLTGRGNASDSQSRLLMESRMLSRMTAMVNLNQLKDFRYWTADVSEIQRLCSDSV